MRSGVALAVLAATAVALVRDAGAQRMTSSVAFTGANVRYADSVGVSAITVSPGLQLERDRATLGVSASYSQLTSGGWTMQGAGNGSLFTPFVRSLTGEFSASLGGSMHKDGTRTGQSIASARVHLMTPERGGWIGAGAGGTWDEMTWRSLLQGEAALWSRIGEHATALVTITPIVVDDSSRYTDAEMAAHWDGSRTDFTASAGARSGRPRGALSGVGAWGSVSVAAWLTPGLAIVGSAGVYPADLTQGFPEGRFVSVGVRLGQRSRRHPIESTPRVISSEREIAEPIGAQPIGIERFVMSAAGAGRRTLRVLAPNARTVEINGDFTHWTPVRLAKIAGGWWSVTLPVTTGTYQMNLRLDGGAWISPPGLTSLKDEFGGAVGLLIIP